jgi:hypothetical protein
VVDFRQHHDVSLASRIAWGTTLWPLLRSETREGGLAHPLAHLRIINAHAVARRETPDADLPLVLIAVHLACSLADLD